MLEKADAGHTHAVALKTEFSVEASIMRAKVGGGPVPVAVAVEARVKRIRVEEKAVCCI